MVNGLAITEANYQVACDLLVNRYGRKERIIFAHIQGLLNLVMPVQSKVSRVTLLWRLLDEVLTHIRSLESLGIRGSEYGVFLTPVILSRLPQDIRMEWSRDGEGKESDLDWMLTFLTKEIERRERSETFKSVLTSKNEIGGTPAEERRRGGPPTVLALFSANQWWMWNLQQGAQHRQMLEPYEGQSHGQTCKDTGCRTVLPMPESIASGEGVWRQMHKVQR